MEYIKVKSLVNPKDKIEYYEGDKVVIYQGRFGHNNIIQIKSIWLNKEFPELSIVSQTEENFGIFISEITTKISDEEINKIKRAKIEYKYAEKYNIKL